jgi:hypothetical protein
MVCGRSLSMAEAARSNCSVSWRLGQVEALVFDSVKVTLLPLLLLGEVESGASQSVLPFEPFPLPVCGVRDEEM